MINKINSSTNNMPSSATEEQKNIDKKYIPEPYRKFAKDQETQFIEFMLTQMDKTVDKSEEDSTASSYYNSMVLNERATQMSETKGGLGIQDLILNQVYPQKFRNKFAYEQYQRQASAQQQGNTKNNQPTIQHIELKDNQNE